MVGETVVSFAMSSSNTVKDVKERIRSATSVPMFRHQVVCGSGIPKDHDRIGDLVAEDGAQTLSLMLIAAREAVGNWCVFCDGRGVASFRSCVWCHGTGNWELGRNR